MEVVVMLFTYPTNCHMLRFNTNRPLYGLPSKKGREQFERRTHKRLIDIMSPTQKTVEALMNLEVPAGVEIEIKL